MQRVIEVNESNKQRIIEFLKEDAVKHVFALYDIQHDLANTKIYLALKNEALDGYLLIYTAMAFPSVILEGKMDAAKTLIS